MSTSSQVTILEDARDETCTGDRMAVPMTQDKHDPHVLHQHTAYSIATIVSGPRLRSATPNTLHSPPDSPQHYEPHIERGEWLGS